MGNPNIDSTGTIPDDALAVGVHQVTSRPEVLEEVGLQTPREQLAFGREVWERHWGPASDVRGEAEVELQGLPPSTGVRTGGRHCRGLPGCVHPSQSHPGTFLRHFHFHAMKLPNLLSVPFESLDKIWGRDRHLWT